MDMAWLRDCVLKAVGSSQRARLSGDERWLLPFAGRLEDARSALGFDLERATVVAHVVQQLDSAIDPVEQLVHSIDVEGLYLALGASLGHRKALAVFERRHGEDIARAAARLHNTAVTPDEFQQRVRERLFVEDGNHPPRLLRYSGRGPLKAWVRTTAVRAMIDVARSPEAKRPHDVLGEDVLQQIAGGIDAESSSVQEEHRDLVQRALLEALRELTPRQRNLLRQRFFHGLGATALATIYGVHRATVARWFEQLHTRLATFSRAHLMRELETSDVDVQRVFGELRSRTNLSIRRLLDSSLEPDLVRA